jgi:hypothetical protein
MGRVEAHMVFWWVNLSERCYLEELQVDRRIVLKWGFKGYDGGDYWIYVTQDRKCGGTVVNSVMKVRVP